MATNSIRIDDSVKEETTLIASQLGLTFNGVVNILLRKFNAEKGFPFELKLQENKTVFDMDSAEFERRCREAVRNREDVPSFPYTTRIDDNGRVYKQYEDGRVEYIVL
mgnify:CR=1 FL=1